MLLQGIIDTRRVCLHPGMLVLCLLSVLSTHSLAHGDGEPPRQPAPLQAYGGLLSSPALATFLHSKEGKEWVEEEWSKADETSVKIPDIIPDIFYRGYQARMQEVELDPIHGLYNVSPTCYYDLKQLENVTNLENVKSAIKMVDASGKIPYGVLNGNLGDWGSYDECSTVDTAHYCLTSAEIEIFGSINLPQLQWGFCVPLSCSPRDVAKAMYFITHLAEKNHVNVTLSGTAAFCEKSESISSDRGALAFLGVIAMLGVAVVGCTILDLTIYAPEAYKDDQIPVPSAAGTAGGGGGGGGGGAQYGALSTQVGPPGRIDAVSVQTADSETPLLGSSVVGPHHHHHHHHHLHHHHHPRLGQSPLAPSRGHRGRQGVGSRRNKSVTSSGIDVGIVNVLSLAKNARRLFDTSTKPESEHLLALNGMRTLSLLWVILAHTHYFVLIGALDNRTVISGTVSRFTFQIVSNAVFSVDSFFFLSGFLVCYLTLGYLQRTQGTFPWLRFYLHRYWRLTPTLIFMVLVWWKLTPYFGDGPVWFAQQYPNSCEEYWWTNLVYVNNFIPHSLGKSCLSWSWYLANDMQFFIISPVFLILLHKRPLWGYLSIATALTASFVTTGLIVNHYGLNANVIQEMLMPQALGDYTSLIYDKPYCRITPYLVGILVAHLVRMHRLRPSRPLNGLLLVCGWVLAWSAMLVALFAFYGQYHGREWSNLANILYTSFARFAWACALGWVTWLCTTGQGGMVNQLLASPLWQPLARLTYCTYLVHPMIMVIVTGQVRHPVHYDQVSQALRFLGFTMFSYAIGSAIALFVEFPLSSLEKLLMITSRGDGGE